MRVTGKRQMRSGWYRREPHRIMGKHNCRLVRREASQHLFGSRSLHACIRNAHDVDDATVENHGSLFIIENDNAVPPQDGNNFFRAVNVIMISENSVSATGSVQPGKGRSYGLRRYPSAAKQLHVDKVASE